MPDGMTTPENPYSKFNIGKPTPLPGGGMQIPDSVKNLQEIKMMADEEGENSANNEIDARDILRALGARANTSEIEKFGNVLSKYENKKQEAVRQGKELDFALTSELQKQYELMIEQGTKPIHKFYEKIVKQKKNAYPYDHRVAEATIEAAIDSSETFRNEEWLKSSEGKVWLKMMERDSEWMASSFQIAVENSASLPYYYDVVQQMQILKSPYRAYVTDDDLQGAFAKEVDGLEYTDIEKEIIKKNKIGLSLDKRYIDAGFIKEGETIGVRELGIKLQDASFEQRMKIAAVSQMNLMNSNPETTTFMNGNLTKLEADFYKDLLWRHEWKEDKKEGEGYVLAPHVVSGSYDRKESESVLEALLVTNASERLQNIQKMEDGPDKINALSKLNDEVKEESLSRRSNWKKRASTDIVSNLATLVTKQGLLQDYAFMHAYRYCWARKWNVDKEGKAFSQKEIELGSIYSPSGDIPSLYWYHRHHNYNKQGNSDTPFLLPTSSRGREIVKNLPPNEVPKYKRDYSDCPDEFLREQWKFLFSNENIYVQERKGMGYGPIQEDVANKLKEWAYRYITPFNNHEVGETGLKYELELPMFFPEGVSVANFFETFTVTKDKVNKGAETAWDQLVGGKKLSEIDWKGHGLDTQPTDRWHVDMDMASRYMRVLIELFDKDKDPFMNLVAGGPGTMGPKELAKRLRLSVGRDGANAQTEMYEVGFIPFFITLACANKHGISGSSAWEKTSREDKEANSCAADRFFMEMAYWKRAFNWMPGDKPSENLKHDNTFYKIEDEENTWKYGNSMALMAEFYETLIARISKSSSNESRFLAQKNYRNTTNRINKLGFLKKGAVSYELQDSKNLVN